MKRLVPSILAAALVCAAVLAGGASPGVARQQATTINYATSFGNFGRDAYVYVAIERGYFVQEDLDVKVVPGNGSVDVMKLVAAGRLDYGPVDIGALVVTKANEGLPLKVTSVIHQNSMSSIFTLAESGITTPKGLEGHTVADAPGSTVRVLFPLYAKRAGIDASKVKFRDAAPPALPALLASKQVDGIGQFSVGLPLVAKAAGGKPIRSFKYSKAMPGLLGIGVVASREHDPHEAGRGAPVQPGAAEGAAVGARQPGCGRLHPEEVQRTRRPDRGRAGAADHEVLLADETDASAGLRPRLHRHRKDGRDGEHHPERIQARQADRHGRPLYDRRGAGPEGGAVADGALIEVERVSKTFETRKGLPVVALADIDLAVGENEFVDDRRPRRAAASRRCCGSWPASIPASAGSVSIGGSAVASPGRDVGFVFQRPALLPWRTVLENVLLPRRARRRRACGARERGRSSCSSSSASRASRDA